MPDAVLCYFWHLKTVLLKTDWNNTPCKLIYTLNKAKFLPVTRNINVYSPLIIKSSNHGLFTKVKEKWQTPSLHWWILLILMFRHKWVPVKSLGAIFLMNTWFITPGQQANKKQKPNWISFIISQLGTAQSTGGLVQKEHTETQTQVWRNLFWYWQAAALNQTCYQRLSLKLQVNILTSVRKEL